MISAMRTEVRYHDFVGQSLDELKATVSKVVLIIGNDSGPIYMAESFGAGTLVLVGPTDEAEHPLQDATHRIVMSKNRGKALLQSAVSAEDTIDLKAARSQIEAITVEQVCLEIDDLFNNLKIEERK
jgi:ADP-heptose:LPS heptosyltransferase